MINDEILGSGHELSAPAIKLAVYNWAFSKGLTVMHYDYHIDTWFMSDGEPYTTTLILREEAAQ